jgi:hypothetical protein
MALAHCHASLLSPSLLLGVSDWKASGISAQNLLLLMTQPNPKNHSLHEDLMLKYQRTHLII